MRRAVPAAVLALAVVALASGGAVGASLATTGTTRAAFSGSVDVPFGPVSAVAVGAPPPRATPEPAPAEQLTPTATTPATTPTTTPATRQRSGATPEPSSTPTGPAPTTAPAPDTAGSPAPPEPTPVEVTAPTTPEATPAAS